MPLALLHSATLGVKSKIATVSYLGACSFVHFCLGTFYQVLTTKARQRQTDLLATLHRKKECYMLAEHLLGTESLLPRLDPDMIQNRTQSSYLANSMKHE